MTLTFSREVLIRNNTSDKGLLGLMFLVWGLLMDTSAPAWSLFIQAGVYGWCSASFIRMIDGEWDIYE